jgi:hypothetical protein
MNPSAERDPCNPKKNKASRVRKTTSRQRRYASAIIGGKTKEAAKREAGYAPTTKAKVCVANCRNHAAIGV